MGIKKRQLHTLQPMPENPLIIYSSDQTILYLQERLEK